MKSVWKGLVVGSLTGMVGGVALDMATAGGRKATRIANTLAEKAGSAVEAAPSIAKTTTRAAAAKLHDADLSGKVDQAAAHIEGSDVVAKIKNAVGL